ncbi:MAG TPA: hypothetical protein VHU40_22145 [Polyangia bacterium]|nr:hypothetical protein [Polyangia bacterium]
MNFGSWHDLVDAPRVAPEQAGVLQARARSLRSFPAGKSAMVLYASSGAGQTLRRYVADEGQPHLTRAAAAGASLIRFGVTPRPDDELDRLLGQFTSRFGALPPGNALVSNSESTNKDGSQGHGR